MSSYVQVYIPYSVCIYVCVYIYIYIYIYSETAECIWLSVHLMFICSIISGVLTLITIYCDRRWRWTFRVVKLMLTSWQRQRSDVLPLMHRATAHCDGNGRSFLAAIYSKPLLKLLSHSLGVAYSYSVTYLEYKSACRVVYAIPLSHISDIRELAMEFLLFDRELYFKSYA